MADLLTAARQAELRDQAKVAAFAEIQEEAERQFLADEKARAKRHMAGLPDEIAPTDELIEEIEINLAPHSDKIVLDGRQYYHGFKYKFRATVVSTILEIMHRTWAHEREIGGANTNAMHGMRERNRYVKQGSVYATR